VVHATVGPRGFFAVGWLGEKRIRCGDFAGFQQVLRRNDEIAEGFGYQDARLGGMGDRVYLLLEQGRFAEAVEAADVYQEESPQQMLHVLALGARAEAQVRAGALADAASTLARGESMLGRMGLGQAIPYHVSFFDTARFLFEVATLEASGTAPAGLRRSRAKALATVGKVASRRPQVYRLAGREAWLRGRRKAALRWWGRSLAEAERLAARPEQARTWHELAVRLAPDARGPDGRSGAECASAAADLYRELHLAGDLARLEAGVAA
jgi:tetratricopeptide (TPR) repeat protein